MAAIRKVGIGALALGLGLCGTTAFAQTGGTVASPAVGTAIGPGAAGGVPAATLGILNPGGLSFGTATGSADPGSGDGTMATGPLTTTGGLSFGGASAPGSLAGAEASPGAATGSVIGSGTATGAGGLSTRPRPLEDGIGTAGGGAPAGAGLSGGAASAPSRADAFFDPLAGSDLR